MFSSTFKPLLNLNRTLPGHEPMVQFYVRQISWTEHKVWFWVQQNSGRTELNRTSASLPEGSIGDISDLGMCQSQAQRATCAIYVIPCMC